MSSRRRLDISSLLCDNEEASVNRPDSQLSRSPAHSPTQQQPAAVRVRSYSSSERSALAPASNPYSSPQYEQSQQQQLSPTYQDSPRSLPSATVLTPLALQPSPTRRRTPSPPFSLSSASPVDHSAPLRRGHRSEDVQGSGFPRPQHSGSGSYTTQTQTHPHLYNQYPPPPSSTSPVNVHEKSRGRRASIQVKDHQYSPTLQTHPSLSSSSLPSKFPSSAQPLSVSTTDLPHSTQISTSSASGRYFQHSPVLSRLPETRMLPSQRASASLSPTVPTSGLSGLDVLVQAATEERERIDVHRRQSGGEEPQLPFNYTTARPASLSPVEFRSDMRLQAPPPTPPYTASSHTTGYLPVDQADTYYKGQAFGEDGRAIKRRRSSPESSHLQQIDVHQASQYGPCSTLPLSDSGLRRRSQSPEATYDKYEHQSHMLDTTSHLPSTSSGHTSVSKPGSLYAPSSSARTNPQQGAFEDTQMNSPSRYLLPLSPVEPVVVPRTRRSPPRSKPRPKKPGSAALAVMEKEFRGVALSDRERRGVTESQDENSARKNISKSSSSRPQTQPKMPGMSTRSLQSNERGAADDEDVDDFFLSTFDSPRNAERQIPSQDSSLIISSAEIEENGYTAARWSNKYSRHTIPIQSATEDTKLRSPTPEAMKELSDNFSPVRRTPDFGDEGLMSEVEAEILDELADAAGAATSEDERTEFDDQGTDTMEVDVEDELLSLIDGPSELHSKPHQHSGPLISYAQRTFATPQYADFDRMSMPPPDVLKATGAQLRDSKKGSAKPRARGKVDDATRFSEVLSAQVEDSGAKQQSSKSKSSSKPRPTKGISSDKTKVARMSKEPSTPVSSSLPTLSMPLPNSSTSTGEVFPTVTSSGRMVTKSKKSAAAAAAASTVPASQTSSSQNRKKPAASGGGDGATSRSRSHSAMPRASVDPEVHREKSAKVDEEKARDLAAEEAEGGDKDKLYCVCRTQYDEDRVMIACDRCDEWYHTQCVNMPDLLIDLVDQFICTNCIARNPSLNLRTTYKQRCLSGLNHPYPDSADACHKPSRGAYSKYCTDECGVRHMHRKIQTWASKGGDVRGLWESVKDAKRREGFVTREPGRTLPKAILAEIQNNVVPEPQRNIPEANELVGDEDRRDSIVARLEKQLQIVVRDREERKKELEVICWRERLLQLASERAESVGDCGWDQRLVYGDEEWLEFGAGVLESYEDSAPNGHSEENQDMEVDGQALVGEWWCQGKKKCERHVGWQRVRSAGIEKERVTKERELAELTTREREIRSRIEDVLHPQLRPAGGVKRTGTKSVAAA